MVKDLLLLLACYENSKHQCLECSKKEANEFKNKYSVDCIKKLCMDNNSYLVKCSNNSDYINTKSKVTLKCQKCGRLFTSTLGYILRKHKFLCNDCSYENAPSSNGEILIKTILDSIDNITYKEQYSFDDCKDKYMLRFDFAVFSNNQIHLIEFDGIQHFSPFDFYGGINKYDDVVRKDNIKNEYCKNHRIPILRIKYDETDIQSKIKDFLIT